MLGHPLNFQGEHFSRITSCINAKTLILVFPRLKYLSCILYRQFVALISTFQSRSCTILHVTQSKFLRSFVEVTITSFFVTSATSVSLLLCNDTSDNSGGRLKTKHATHDGFYSLLHKVQRRIRKFCALILHHLHCHCSSLCEYFLTRFSFTQNLLRHHNLIKSTPITAKNRALVSIICLKTTRNIKPKTF